MIRFLTALALFSLTAGLSPLALAADDGGFGTQRFSSQAPNALNDTPSDDPSSIEPAAGPDETETQGGEAETTQATPEPTTAPVSTPDASPAQ